MPDRLFHGNTEPSIDELLSDPIAQLLRNRDRIAVGDVLITVEQAKAALLGKRLPDDDGIGQ